MICIHNASAPELENIHQHEDKVSDNPKKKL